MKMAQRIKAHDLDLIELLFGVLLIILNFPDVIINDLLFMYFLSYTLCSLQREVEHYI